MRQQANSKLAEARANSKNCLQINDYVKALEDYEQIRRNNPALALKDVNAKSKIARVREICIEENGGSGGVTNKRIVDLRTALTKTKFDIIQAEIEAGILDNEKLQLTTKIDTLQKEKDNLSAQDPNIKKVEAEEKVLIESLSNTNEKIVNNAKTIKKLDSFKFKVSDSLFKITQKFGVN